MEEQRKSTYGLFAAMIGTSTVVMFGLMYLILQPQLIFRELQR